MDLDIKGTIINYKPLEKSRRKYSRYRASQKILRTPDTYHENTMLENTFGFFKHAHMYICIYPTHVYLHTF